MSFYSKNVIKPKILNSAKKISKISIIFLSISLFGCDCEQGFMGIECPQFLDSHTNKARYKKIEENYQIIKNLDRQEMVIEIMGEPDLIEKSEYPLSINTSKLVWKTDKHKYSIDFINGVVTAKNKKTIDTD